MVKAIIKRPQHTVKPQKQSVLLMFRVPVHRLVISRACDRTLASKYCAINSSIYSMLFMHPVYYPADITCLQWGIR